jgi:YgiT-type zinc finger domain-containing protein
VQQQGVCAYCAGPLREAVVRHAVTHGSRVVVFTDVPARVCGQCGEPFFAGAVVDEMNRFAWALGEPSEAPGRDLSVHVHSLGAAVATT